MVKLSLLLRAVSSSCVLRTLDLAVVFGSYSSGLWAQSWWCLGDFMGYWQLNPVSYVKVNSLHGVLALRLPLLLKIIVIDLQLDRLRIRFQKWITA